MGPLPMSHDGFEYIMVVEDYYSKYAEAYSLNDHTAQTVGDKLLTEFICRFGVPSSIHTDQGREFESNLFQHLCKVLGADKTRTTPYHPESVGMVERQNRTIQQMLSMYVNERRDDWSDHLDLVMMAYRSSVHHSTGCTPNLICLWQRD
jgi:transposase InsO family protein